MTPLHHQGPALDRAHLERMTMGDADLQAEVLSLFRGQTQAWMRLLEADTPTADWAVAVHTIKGSARGVGAWALAQACEEAEAEARDNAPLSGEAKHWWKARIGAAIDHVLDAVARLEHQRAVGEFRSASKDWSS